MGRGVAADVGRGVPGRVVGRVVGLGAVLVVPAVGPAVMSGVGVAASARVMSFVTLTVHVTTLVAPAPASLHWEISVTGVADVDFESLTLSHPVPLHSRLTVMVAMPV